MNLLEIHDFARDVARIGGQVTLEWFSRTDLAVERKADDTPVTIADRTTEKVMRDAIRQRFPDHLVVGEEEGGEITGSGMEWVIDPIDGTKTFIRGVPLYTTLLAVLLEGVPQVGVIHAPATGELVSALLGQGAWDERRRPVRVSAVKRLENAWYVTTDPADFYRRDPGFSTALLDRCASARTWADAYGYMLLARGAIDIMIDPILAPWDVAPLGVIVREAGGVFTDFSGVAQNVGESSLACATKELHREVLKLRETCASGA
ncbi:MAG: histidinol-phosphatase [Spirochaetaceae bacterium]|nr:MAG: histidinol-phosphatase [Spirochaetaceae bacterium]